MYLNLRCPQLNTLQGFYQSFKEPDHDQQVKETKSEETMFSPANCFQKLPVLGCLIICFLQKYQ